MEDRAPANVETTPVQQHMDSEPKKPVILKKPYGSQVDRIPCQCGMNFVYSLGASYGVREQIAILDYAFNAWGHGDWLASSYTEGYKEPKSQVMFTDKVDSSSWKEIKKIAFCGPVTVNERDFHKNNIAVYVLTRDEYYKWREEWLKDHPEDHPEDDPEFVSKKIKEPVTKSPVSSLREVLSEISMDRLHWRD